MPRQLKTYFAEKMPSNVAKYIDLHNFLIIVVNLHRLISAAIGRWVTSDPAELPVLPGRKNCALAPLNIIPKFPKEKHKFLSDLSSKSITFMCSICMIAKGYKVFPWKLSQSKNGVCDESPPKRQTVAETFAWRLYSCKWVSILFDSAHKTL